MMNKNVFFVYLSTNVFILSKIHFVFFMLQILSLGCGFDSSFFRLHSEGLLEDTAYYEVLLFILINYKLSNFSSLDIFHVLDFLPDSNILFLIIEVLVFIYFWW